MPHSMPWKRLKKNEQLEREMEALYDEMREEIERMRYNLETEKHNTKELGKHLKAILDYERTNGYDALGSELAGVGAGQLASKRTAAAAEKMRPASSHRTVRHRRYTAEVAEGGGAQELG